MTYLENLFSLKNKVAIVTGAARGNGKAISEALLKSGSSVILVDILEEELQNTVNLFKESKLDAYKHICDITDIGAIQELKEFTKKKFGKLDILVNNAGVTHPFNLFEYPDEFWEKTYKTNLKAPFELSKELGKIMREQRSGVIINITSLNAELAFPDNPAYNSFKGALKQLSKSLALDLGQYGIRVNNVGPGYFHTNMTKQSWEDPKKNQLIKNRTILGRWGEPEDLAGAIVFLSSDSSSYITGQDIYVDGGWLSKGM